MTGWVLITLKSEDSMDRNVHLPKDIHHNERTDFSSLLGVAEVGFHQRVAINLRQHPPTGRVSGSVRTQITARGPEHKPRSITEQREGKMKQRQEARSPYPHGKTSIFCQATWLLVITGCDERRVHSQKSAGQRDNARSEERPMTIVHSSDVACVLPTSCISITETKTKYITISAVNVTCAQKAWITFVGYLQYATKHTAQNTASHIAMCAVFYNVTLKQSNISCDNL